MTDDGVTSEAAIRPAGAPPPANGGARTKAILLLAAMFVLGGAAGVAVGRASAVREIRHMMEGPPGASRVNFRIEALRRHLDLSAAQVDQLRAVMAESDAEREKLMAACDPGMDDLRKRTDAKVRALLDEAQRKRFDDLSKRRGRPPGPWMDGPPPPPPPP